MRPALLIVLLTACTSGASKPADSGLSSGGGTGDGGTGDGGSGDGGTGSDGADCTEQPGIATSTDRGSSWDSPEPDGHDGCWALAVLDDGTVFASCDRPGGFSSDGGCTWEPVGLEYAAAGMLADGDTAWLWTWDTLYRGDATTGATPEEAWTGLVNPIGVGRGSEGLLMVSEHAHTTVFGEGAPLDRPPPPHESDQFQVVHAALEGDTVAIFVRTSPSTYALYRSLDAGQGWTQLTMEGTPDPEEPGGLLIDQGRLFVGFDGLLLYPPGATEPERLSEDWLTPLGVPPEDRGTLWYGTGTNTGLDVGTLDLTTTERSQQDWPWPGGRAVDLQWVGDTLWAAHLLNMDED